MVWFLDLYFIFPRLGLDAPSRIPFFKKKMKRNIKYEIYIFMDRTVDRNIEKVVGASKTTSNEGFVSSLCNYDKVFSVYFCPSVLLRRTTRIKKAANIQTQMFLFFSYNNWWKQVLLKQPNFRILTLSFDISIMNKVRKLQ